MRQKTRGEDREEHPPLVAAVKQYWGSVKFAAIPIEHTGTTLTRTLDHLTAAFSTVRLRVDHTSASKDTTKPITDSNAKSHDYRMLKSLLDALTDLAQSQVLCIIRKTKRLVEALPEPARRNRAHSTATPTPTNAIANKAGVAITIYMTCTTHVLENTAIT